MRRRRIWLSRLDQYARVPEELRGYLLDGPDAVPVPRSPARAARGSSSSGTALLPAGVRPPGHPAREGRRVLVPGPGPQSRGHHPAGARRRTPGAGCTTWPPGRPRRASRTPVTWDQLQEAARAMDEAESTPVPERAASQWAYRLTRVELLVRQQDGFARAAPWRSATCCTSSAWWARARARSATCSPSGRRQRPARPRRVTLVVADVAEALAVTALSPRSASPPPRCWGLHPRAARPADAPAAGRPRSASLLAHDSPAFDYLSTACPLDALRGVEARTPATAAPSQTAPCTAASTSRRTRCRAMTRKRGAARARPPRRGCPLWSSARATTAHGTWSRPRSGSRPRRASCIARCRRTRTPSGSATWSWPAGSAT